MRGARNRKRKKTKEKISYEKYIGTLFSAFLVPIE